MSSRSSRTIALLGLIAISLGACVAPQSQMGTIGAVDLANEAETQSRFAIESEWENQARVDRLLYPLARASVGLCGPKARPELGARLAVRDSWTRDFRSAAAALGISDSVTVTHVSPGSPIAKVLQPGDRILRLNDKPVGPKATGLDQAKKTFRTLQTRAPSALRVVYARPSTPRNGLVGGPVRVDSGVFTPDLLCSGIAEVIREDEINAYADGELVYATTGMLRFASDGELQTVLAHEIAHNAERHIEAKMTNAGWGALLGIVADLALVSLGVNSEGALTEWFSEIAAMAFSQDFEREADYVGAYILARANQPTEKMSLFWRRIAAESPESIKFASSHPTSAERFVRLQQYHVEIQGKRAGGGPLSPNRKSERK